MKRFGTSWGSKSWALRRHRLQQAFGTDDFHHPLQVVGEHIQAHRHIPLQILVVFQVLRRAVGDVGVDVLRRLLPADTNALHQMACGQTALPPGDGLDQAVAQRQIPAHGLDFLLAFHPGLTCSKTLPVRVNTIDMSSYCAYLVLHKEDGKERDMCEQLLLDMLSAVPTADGEGIYLLAPCYVMRQERVTECMGSMTVSM